MADGKIKPVIRKMFGVLRLSGFFNIYRMKFGCIGENCVMGSLEKYVLSYD